MLNNEHCSDNQYIREMKNSIENDFRKVKNDFKLFFVKTHT